MHLIWDLFLLLTCLQGITIIPFLPSPLPQCPLGMFFANATVVVFSQGILLMSLSLQFCLDPGL